MMEGLGRRIGGGMILLVALVLGLAPIAAAGDALPGDEIQVGTVGVADEGSGLVGDDSTGLIEGDGTIAPAPDGAAVTDDAEPDPAGSPTPEDAAEAGTTMVGSPSPVDEDGGTTDATSAGRVVVGMSALDEQPDVGAEGIEPATDDAAAAGAEAPSDESSSPVDGDADAGHADGDHTDGGHTGGPPDGPHDDGSHDDGSHDDGSHDDHGGQPVRLRCADIDPTWVELELKGHPISGVHTIGDDFRTVQVVVRDAPPGGKLVDWSSDGPIDAVILRSGQDAATYEYEPPALADTGLLPPLKERDGRNLASVKACYDPSDPVVGIDLVLVDSDDPVEVGDDFDYRLDISTSNPLVDAEVMLTLPPEIGLVDAAGCSVDDGLIRCAPPLASEAAWQGTISVTAASAGNAIARAELRATAGGEEFVVSSVEVTRIIGPPGSGGCGGHDDGGHDDGGHDDGGHDDGGHDDGGHEDGGECPGATRDLVAACGAIDPAAVALVLAGPFANRDYLLEGDDGAWVQVTVSEATGVQAASWSSNIPIDAVFARTGRDVATFAYDPAAFLGEGIVGPPGGSGKPRPMADLAVCFVPRTAVDVGIEARGPEVMQVGETGTIEVEVGNAGYRAAEGVSVALGVGPHLTAAACGAERCALTEVEAGSGQSVLVEVKALQVGTAEVVVDVVAANESPDHEGDNAATLTIVVEAAEDDGSLRDEEPVEEDPPAEEPPIDTIVKASGETLPETGPVDMMWQFIVAIGLVATGTVLVRWERVPG